MERQVLSCTYLAHCELASVKTIELFKLRHINRLYRWPSSVAALFEPTSGWHTPVNSFTCCRAPEPTDVWWENLSVRGREAWQLRLQSAAITIAVVAAGGVVQYYLAQAGEGERSRRLTYEVCRPCVPNVRIALPVCSAQAIYRQACMQTKRQIWFYQEQNE